jgi:hypothetical protein
MRTRRSYTIPPHKSGKAWIAEAPGLAVWASERRVGNATRLLNPGLSYGTYPRQKLPEISPIFIEPCISAGKRASLCRCPFMLSLEPVSQFRPLRRDFFERGPSRRVRCLRRTLSGFAC